MMVEFFKRLFAVLFGKPATPAVPVKPSEPRWLTEARKDIGFREVSGNRGIERFIDEAIGIIGDGKKLGKLGDPWCAIFINAKLEECGVPGSRSAMARSFETHPNFIELDGPALGAISTFWRGSPNAGTGHVNFYAGTLPDGRHIGIGGNQSDQVSAIPMDMSRHTGWWWPVNEPLPKIGEVPATIKGVVAGGSET